MDWKLLKDFEILLQKSMEKVLVRERFTSFYNSIRHFRRLCRQYCADSVGTIRREWNCANAVGTIAVVVSL